MNQQALEKNSIDAPYSLKSSQEWFASVITYPLAENDLINPTAPSGSLIAEEAARYILPSPTLPPHQRMQIYNQQYWWRLLNTLHANFPLVTRLFGYNAFNEEIGVPYLHRYPPHHWSLTLLGDRLPLWIEQYYRAPDLPLVQNASKLDWAFTLSFIAPHYSPLDLNSLIQGDPSSLLSYTFYLQPHIHLFKWDYDLLAFREEFLKKEVDYWTENRFPKLLKRKAYCFALFRTLKNNLAWREITPGEYLLLELFQKGAKIEEACAHIESQEEKLYDHVAAHLHQWLQDWTRLGWLTLQKNEQE
ncbi:DNA-binding domain-containing protein [Candidatus Protochlamydia phocaeensis]|uniref:HvfC/BufC N-terminal domain-containing protein n=1 Tax=Candidatus Protochlamydia phocaeensis TaxID=1414722 RepID=UPI00083885E3|nr:DNA-binding domain-containing protein [Candidatus Protochlamydia phocaeensis]